MNSTIDMQSVYYTASTNNETLITFAQLQSSASQTVTVITVTKEIKQLLTTEYTIDTTTGIIALQNGLSLVAGETLFVLYKVTQSAVLSTSLSTQLN